jgi:hypothetical protein
VRGAVNGQQAGLEESGGKPPHSRGAAPATFSERSLGKSVDRYPGSPAYSPSLTKDFPGPVLRNAATSPPAPTWQDFEPFARPGAGPLNFRLSTFNSKLPTHSKALTRIPKQCGKPFCISLTPWHIPALIVRPTGPSHTWASRSPASTNSGMGSYIHGNSCLFCDIPAWFVRTPAPGGRDWGLGQRHRFASGLHVRTSRAMRSTAFHPLSFPRKACPEPVEGRESTGQRSAAMRNACFHWLLVSGRKAKASTTRRLPRAPVDFKALRGFGGSRAGVRRDDLRRDIWTRRAPGAGACGEPLCTYIKFLILSQ